MSNLHFVQQQLICKGHEIDGRHLVTSGTVELIQFALHAVKESALHTGT